MKRPRKLRKPSKLIAAGIVLMLITVGSGLLSGCSESGKQETAPATSAVQPKPQVITKPTATVVEEAPQVVFTYNPIGKRDPFAPIVHREEQKARSGDRPPLERYNLHEFTLSGIVWGGYGYSALLQGPDGKGYFVRVGTVIGPNKGVIKKITSHNMVIEEKFKNSSGETEKKEIVVELRKKQEGMQ